MSRRKLLWGAGGLVAVAILAFATQGLWRGGGAVAQSQRGGPAERSVPVEVAKAEKAKYPVRIDLLGTVTPIASVSVKPRIDSQIIEVGFRDGAMVQTGDLLFKFDGRALDTQLRQAQAQLARDQASLEGAERDFNRYSELFAKGATPSTNVDNARTQANVFRAATQADQAQIDNLKVQVTYTSIYAPITGRISMAALKIGNVVRAADLAPLATIVQTAPVYVTFSVPQNQLPGLRQALEQETATIEAAIPGDSRRAKGQVTMVENTVDQTSGMVAVRATMANTDERLWPGTLVTMELTLRDEEAVALPSTAVQVSQTGSFVFIVDNGVAKVKPVKVARTMGTTSILASGLNGGEIVVTDGQLQLKEGTRVAPRAPRAGT